MRLWWQRMAPARWRNRG